MSSPEELAHGNASLVQHRGDDLSQVEPDVGNVYGHVISHLQNLLQPVGQKEAFGMEPFIQTTNKKHRALELARA